MDKKIRMIRKRYFPDEEVDISGDEILYLDEKMLVTEWNPIKPRDDMKRGVSYWFLEEGWKISKIYNNDGSFKHYYCDICRYEINVNEEYKIIDLLVDIIVQKDGSYKVLDFEELSEMYEENNITLNELMYALKSFAKLVNLINEGNFPFNELNEY